MAGHRGTVDRSRQAGSRNRGTGGAWQGHHRAGDTSSHHHIIITP